MAVVRRASEESGNGSAMSAPFASSRKSVLRRTRTAGGYGVQEEGGRTCSRVQIIVHRVRMIDFAMSAPGRTVRDINDWADGQGVSAEQLVPQTSKLDTKTLGGDFAVPVLVIQGAEDFRRRRRVLPRRSLTLIRAPQKALVTIEGGGAFSPWFMRSQAFLGRW